MRTRRQNMLVYNDWLKECVRLLGRSPLEVDRRFARWFDLQKITDETLASFGLDDTSSTAPLTEARVHTVLRWFDKRMEDWKDDTNPDMLTGEFLTDILKRCCAHTISSAHGPRISLYYSCHL